MKNVLVAACFFVLFLSLVSCNKQTETVSSGSINHYYPLQVGKTFLYRLDSTLPAAFGSKLIIKSYQAKDSIESTFSDNLGRLSYRIFRYTRDTLGTKSWSFAATYYATPTNTTLEYVDNNMRFVKLHTPITEGYSWYGHAFIDTKSANSTVKYLDDIGGTYWQYTYQNVGQPYSVLNKRYDSTVVVAQNDETSPPGPFNPSYYQEKNYGVEVYAKGVGLIYKEFLHTVWNVSTAVSGYQDDSYGVKLQLISYN